MSVSLRHEGAKEGVLGICGIAPGRVRTMSSRRGARAGVYEVAADCKVDEAERVLHVSVG